MHQTLFTLVFFFASVLSFDEICYQGCSAEALYVCECYSTFFYCKEHAACDSGICAGQCELNGLSIGIIIGVFVLLLCCIIGCIYCCSRKNNIVYVSPQTVIHSTPIHPIDTVSTPLLNK